MRFPAECYQMLETIERYFASCLRPSQRRGLVYWVYGAILAKSACQTAVIASLLVACDAPVATIRQHLREWLYDGEDKAAPCQTEVDVSACFGPLLRWVLALWHGDQLVLAVDVTNLGDRLHGLCVSVLYRGCAIPVGWHQMPGGEKGAWMPELVRLLELLGAAMPSQLEVLVLMDAGLRSPALWQTARQYGWHPIQRHEPSLQFRPAGWHGFHRADQFVCRPGKAWVGSGTAFKGKAMQRPATLIVVWEEGAAAPWVLLTDLPVAKVGVTWYGLRMWIELGFRALKGMGWQWQRSRRTDPTRVGRHWLVLAVASCWALAAGTRVEDAIACQRAPSRLTAPPSSPPAASASTPTRGLSVFLLGVTALQRQLHRVRLWRRLWLAPEPWPPNPPGLTIWRDTFTPSSP